jgi:hypothetical protein
MYALLLMKDNESLYQAFEKSCLDKPPYLNKEQSIHTPYSILLVKCEKSFCQVPEKNVQMVIYR